MKIKKYLKESDTAFGATMQQLADLIGKGGKYSHKGFSQFIAREYGYKESKKDINVQNVLDDLEDWNYHTEYSILEALVNGNKKAVELLLDIAKAQAKAGHLPSDLGWMRSFLSTKDKKKWVKMQQQLNARTDKPKMRLSSTGSKILKSIPQKEADMFLSIFEIVE